jgi:hypothetical protein
MVKKKWLKVNALVPSERKKECLHSAGYRWTGTMPCTGVLKCYMCNHIKGE